MGESPAFDRSVAFGRTIGWITRAELDRLGEKRVAIAGLGGVGGAHLATLARLGVGRFSICDPDTFELANLNRQIGATMATLGRSKVEVMAELARAVNPELDLRASFRALGPDEVDAFLDGADLYLDGLDLFAIEARRLVFARCAALGVPAVTAAPLGMGAAMLVFLPGRTSFEEYFRLEGQPRDEQILRLLIGLAPAALQRFYMIDAPRLADEQAASTPMAVELCAGLAATAAMKILLGRGPVLAAPWGIQLDAYLGRARRTWRPGGNAHPLQRIALHFARRRIFGARPALPPG